MPGRQLRDMAPWDAQTYYFIPEERTVAVGNTPVLVARGDPMRTVLVFGLNDSLAATIYVNVSLSRTVSNVSGVPVSATQQALVFTWETHGPLVQQPWYAAKSQLLGATPNLTIQTVRLQRWPADSDRLSLIEQVDANAIQTPARRANGYDSIYRGGTDSGAESQAREDSDIASAIESCKRGFQQDCDRIVWMAPGGWRISPGAG